MISRPFKIAFVWLLFVVGIAGIVALRLDGSRLRQRIADARRQKTEGDRLRDDQRHVQELLTRAEKDADGGTRQIHAEVVRLRKELADLEKRAESGRAQKLAQIADDTTALANSRDPEKALTRLENFENKGQGTPAAAFQTFVWASMKGEDTTLAEMIFFSGEARAQAEAVIAALPEANRVDYSTPEKLAALFFAHALTATTAAQIDAVSFLDNQNAIVTVRGLTERTQKVPMVRNASGWQVAVPEEMIGKIAGWARGGGPSAPRQ